MLNSSIYNTKSPLSLGIKITVNPSKTVVGNLYKLAEMSDSCPRFIRE